MNHPQAWSRFGSALLVQSYMMTKKHSISAICCSTTCSANLMLQTLVTHWCNIIIYPPCLPGNNFPFAGKGRGLITLSEPMKDQECLGFLEPRLAAISYILMYLNCLSVPNPNQNSYNNDSCVNCCDNGILFTLLGAV